MPADVSPALPADQMCLRDSSSVGDFSRLDDLAARLDDAAAYVRAQARVLADGMGVDWMGSAARRFHANLELRSTEVTLCSRALSEMADVARQEAASARWAEPYVLSGWQYQGPAA